MNYKKLIHLYLFVAVLPYTVFAYGVDTHYKLTENAFKEYTRLGGSLPIKADDIVAAASGAVHEDEMGTHPFGSYYGASRPYNHFYDPINQRGLTVSGFVGMSSPQWAIDTLAQANFGFYTLKPDQTYFSGEADYTWDRAVFEYVHGDKIRAMQSLGHVLHLLEDATSPAHTRNDPHLGETVNDIDPYEVFTERVSPAVTLAPTEVPYFVAPHWAIRDTAQYTNTHFFSKDTVNDFLLPKKESLGVAKIGDYLYATDGSSLLLRTFKVIDDSTFNEITKYSYPLSDPILLTSNWKALSRKAVTNSVALIRLFERDVEEEKKTGALAKKNVSTVEALALQDARVLAAGLGMTNTLVPTQLASVSKSLTVVTPQPLPELPDLDLAYYAPSDETLAAMASAFASANAPLAASNTPPTEPLPVSPAILPEQTAYTPTQANSEQLVVNGGAIVPAPSTQTTTFGGLASFAFGAGVGGGGVQDDRQQTASLTDNRQDQAQNQTQDQTQANNTPPAEPAAGGDVPKTPTCAADETLDATTNTCTKVVPTCTAGTVLDTATNTCLTPPPAAPTLLPDTFTENTTLSGAYTSAEGQTITIPEGVTVTLSAGSTLTLARNTLFVVAGTLDIPGTSDAPVTITTADTATPAYWRGITVTTTGTLSATHATLSYGGYVPAGSSDPTLPRATIRTSGSVTLTDVSIAHSASTAVVHDGPTLATTNLTVEDSLAAIEAFTPYTLTHTTVRRSGADTWVITLHTLLGTITGTVGESNGFNAIALEPFASLLPGATAHLYPNDIAYVMVGDPTISGSLYLHPGIFVQNMPSTRWRVMRGGNIFVPRESGAAPVLTSLYDNATYGEARGTAHAYGNLPDHAPASGDWFGLFIQNADESFVDPTVEVRYGPQQNQ